MIRHWPDTRVEPSDGKSVRRVVMRVLYDCFQLCQLDAGNPSGDMQARAACRCTLPGFDRARWDPNAHLEAAADAEQHLGELLDGAAQMGVALEHDLDRDGCPWGWVVSRFPSSVSAYSTRRGADSPLRQQSARLWLREPKPSPDLLGWVSYLEAIEDQAFNRYRNLASQ